MPNQKNILTWSIGKLCGALRALADSGAFAKGRRDDILLNEISSRLNKNGSLSPTQASVVRSKLHFYSDALQRLHIPVLDVEESRPVSKDNQYRVLMHNPGQFRIYCPTDSIMRTQVERLHGVAYRKEQGYFLARASHRNGYVLKHCGFIFHKRVAAFMDEPAPKPPDVTMPELNRTLTGYQKEAVSYLVSRRGRAILADEQGLGKTGEAIAWATYTKPRQVLVVCPSSAKGNWAKEIFLWTGSNNVFILYGTKPSEKDLEMASKSTWLIINYDILYSWLPFLKKLKIPAVLMDEVQHIKGRDARRTKSAIQLCYKARHIIAISGTPFENRPIELLTAIQLIDPAIFPFNLQFENKFCDLKINECGVHDATGASNTKELHKLLTDTMMIRRLKKDVLHELPPKRRSVVPLVLTPNQLSKVSKVEKGVWQSIYGGMSSKQQAQAGFMEVKRAVALAKLDLCLDWIADYLSKEEKLVVFAYHYDIIDAVKKRFADIVTGIDGRTPDKKRLGIQEQFQEDPNTRLFVGNIKAAGTVLTLTAARDTATLEFVWTSTAHDQAEDRVHRFGQTNSVTAYYLIVQNTIEERIAALIDRKRIITSQILNGDDPEQLDLFLELLAFYKNTKPPK